MTELVMTLCKDSTELTECPNNQQNILQRSSYRYRSESALHLQAVY